MKFPALQSARSTDLWAFAFIVLIPAIYAAVLVIFQHRVGASDYDQFFVFHELQYWNAHLFGFAKQWSPVFCSGLSLAGEPQVPFASLTMLLSYVLGPLPGLVAGSFAYLIIGWVGAYLYAGLWFLRRMPRALAASLFIGNGFFVSRFSAGHIDFVPFLALPLVLWAIHRLTPSGKQSIPTAVSVLAVALLGCLFAMVIDGAPVAIVHWLFWIAIYSAALSDLKRSARPLLIFLSACALAAVLDAGYLWPMIRAQFEFPRTTEDTFTGPWALVWYLLIPMRGKLLPSNGKGFELSVFIGPVLFYLIWRYRKALSADMPSELKTPLIVVSVFAIWLGMGSLHVVHIPAELSLFDWLRPLPGFRSIGVTGRFWGFLALPLSLLAAAALWRFLEEDFSTARRPVLLLGAALLFQLGFEAESLIAPWLHSRLRPPVPTVGVFTGKPETIVQLAPLRYSKSRVLQGDFITPTHGVVSCYDMDDFLRAPIRLGSNVIQSVGDPNGKATMLPLAAGFPSWNEIRIWSLSPALATTGTPVGSDTVRIVLNQAFNTGWRSADCTVEQGAHGNLVAACSARRLQRLPVTLTFRDWLSDLGARVSVVSAVMVSALLLALSCLRLKSRTALVIGRRIRGAI